MNTRARRRVERTMRGSLVCAVHAVAVMLSAAAGARVRDSDPPPIFELLRRGIGGAVPATPGPAYATSSRIAALDPGALVIDADSGWLVRTDGTGAPIAHVAIGHTDAGTLAYDPIARRAYIADRRGDRVVVVSVGATLAIAASWPTPAEPYGVALTPDRTTAIVTTIADRTAVAYDVATGREQWRAPLDAEPRGISISADGARAAVASLATAGVGVIDLVRHHLARHAYAAAAPTATDAMRGAFAVTYLGDHLLAAPLQLERPVTNHTPDDEDDEGEDGGGRYGGSVEPPISHGIAFVDDRGDAATALASVVEPRAVAWDGTRDLLYVAGMASDALVQIAHGSQLDPRGARTARLGAGCGADGLAIEADGGVLVWCSFSRAVVRVALGSAKPASGPEVAPSSLDASRHAGLVLFHTAAETISTGAALSCGSCHLDGRADGESWLIHGERLQTPMLAGRIAGTAPYKWDGGAKTLTASLRATVERLGGSGLTKAELAVLAAYLEGIPPVQTPTRDPAAVARGELLFESAELGCTTCHDGPAWTDRERHRLPASEHAFDTPSLVGIAASAPYFHDGSAPTLDALLRDHGEVHGMAAATTGLTDAQLADLQSFLETH